MTTKETPKKDPPKLVPGDATPDVTLLDQDNNEVSLSDFKGRSLMVFFYPKALTPG